MSKLTLPIVIGRKYVRRDGAVVTAQAPIVAALNLCAYVGSGAVTGMSDHHVWRSTGAVEENEWADDPLDLVADYIEGAVVDAEMPKGTLHPHFMVLRWIADGLSVQWQASDGTWLDRHNDHNLKEIAENEWHPGRYRLKPRTVRIGEFDVPEPLREAQADGTPVWHPCLYGDQRADMTRWHESTALLESLRRGLCHATEEAAKAHALALLSFTSTTTGAPAA